VSIKHFYVPAPGQTDAAARAATLGASLADAAIATTPRYADRIPSLPAVVCDHGDDIVVIPEPTTPAAVQAAHDELLREHLPTDTAYIQTVANAVTAHTSTTGNPHGITPALIGAATSADIDARLAQVVNAAPAALDTLNEIAAALGNDANFAGTVTAQLAGKASTSHGHDHASLTNLTAGNPHTQYSQTTHNHDTAYSATSHGHSYAAPTHSHALADLPGTLATDAEVAAGYATTGHTHAAAAPAVHAASHASAGTDAITPANIGAAPSSHTHPYEGSGAVATHEAAADPHPTYLTAAEGNAAYATTGHTHAAANDARLLTFTSTADQAVTGTALVNVTNLAFAVAANSTYIFSMWADVTAAGGTTPTHNYQFTGPASPTRVMIKRTQMTSTSAQSTTTVTALATAFGAGAIVAGIKNIFEGVIVTGANAGTIQLAVTPGGTIPTATIGRGSGGYALKVA